MCNNIIREFYANTFRSVKILENFPEHLNRQYSSFEKLKQLGKSTSLEGGRTHSVTCGCDVKTT